MSEEKFSFQDLLDAQKVVQEINLCRQEKTCRYSPNCAGAAHVLAFAEAWRRKGMVAALSLFAELLDNLATDIARSDAPRDVVDGKLEIIAAIAARIRGVLETRHFPASGCGWAGDGDICTRCITAERVKLGSVEEP
ncbi:MAG: hypothetical protein KF718_16900 [Polyangiaceae bacterium]|nr:hypothetical protein [Polyangiaceae bacterium]